MHGNVNDPRGRAFCLCLFCRAQSPLTAHLVAVPAIIPDELEALVRDVLSDSGYEVARGEDFEVPSDLRIQP